MFLLFLLLFHLDKYRQIPGVNSTQGSDVNGAGWDPGYKCGIQGKRIFCQFSNELKSANGKIKFQVRIVHIMAWDVTVLSISIPLYGTAYLLRCYSMYIAASLTLLKML